MLRVTVQGGTNAGRRIIRQPARKRWTCACLASLTGRTHDPRLVRCPDCGTRRP